MDRTDENLPLPRDGDADNCPGGATLSAYYDGELDASSARQLEQHLASCAPCQAQLQEYRELSDLAARIGAEGLPAARLHKIHRQIDRDQTLSVLRIGTALAGLAASVLVIGSVWLAEIRPTPIESHTIVVVPDPHSQMESIAIDQGRYSPPLTVNDPDLRNQQIYADARLADWMLDSLTGKTR